MTTSLKIIERAWINHQWIDSPLRIDVMNPATKSIIGSVPNLGPKETLQAIDAANAALPVWSKTAPIERANVLLRWHDLILKNKEALSQLLSLEAGKDLGEAHREINYGASFVRWFAEEARRIYGDIIPSDQPNKRYLVTKQAIGVVAAITPWNFPNAMITRKCAPALAAGCTVVLKPSELTPFSALALAALAEEAGFPAGVFNVITGDSEPIGKAFSEDARVRKISFTGSTRVGQWLIEQSAKTVKKLSLELGGNAPFIVFDDANLDQAVAGLVASKFRNSGQTCVCANRILVHRSIYDLFLKKIMIAVQALTIGPLINQAAVNKVQDLVHDAIKQGAECLLGGKVVTPSAGYFFETTVLTNVNANMRIAHEEIFGPVIAIQIFDVDNEAIHIANDSQAGLAAYVFTEKSTRLWHLMDTLQYGMIGANTGTFSDVLAPFGGIKYSGYGREGSKYGIEEYLEIKYLCWDIT